LVTEAHHKIAEHLAGQERRLDRAVRFQLLQARQHFARVPVSRVEAQVVTMLHRKAQRLDDLAFRGETAISVQTRSRRSRLDTLTAAVLRHDPRHALSKMCERLLAERNHLHHAMEHRLHTAGSALRALDARLRSLSPVAVLDRGYALVFNTDGSLVRSAAAAVPGTALTTRVSDGTFTSRVESGIAVQQGVRKHNKKRDQ
jgi:exodeoxyribonuclease VII large subunit